MLSTEFEDKFVRNALPSSLRFRASGLGEYVWGAFGSEENLRYIKRAPSSPPPLFVRSRKSVVIKDHAMAETPTVAVRPLLVHTNQDLSLLFVQSIQHSIILFIKRYFKDENHRKLKG